MRSDAERWKCWDKVEVQRQKQKSVDELYKEGYQLYCQCRYGQAVTFFAQASLLAKREGNLSAQCKNLNWEGYCCYKDNKLKKALTCFLQAEQIGNLDATHQFYNLENLFYVAMRLYMPQAKIRSVLDKLIPYKGSQQIGGSKSIVLKAEYTFFSSCGRHAEALAKAQEAFASQLEKVPYYNDKIYFEDLVTAYRLNNQISDAWATLRRWRKEGSSKFANTKHSQFIQELKLYYYENKFDDAWDVLQRVKAEEQYLGRTGMYVDTLELDILIGMKMGRLEQVKSALDIIFKKYRNSESLDERYICYKAFASYCSDSCRIVSLESCGRVKQHAEFWLKKAAQMAEYLDGLTQATWRTEQIKKIRKDFEKT